MKLKSTKIGVIGLGYVGLPLAIEFSYQFPVIGFDINANRILDLNSGVDSTNEVEIANLKKANNIIFTSDADTLQDCNFYIVTVPTPIDEAKSSKFLHSLAPPLCPPPTTTTPTNMYQNQPV